MLDSGHFRVKCGAAAALLLLALAAAGSARAAEAGQGSLRLIGADGSVRFESQAEADPEALAASLGEAFGRAAGEELTLEVRGGRVSVGSLRAPVSCTLVFRGGGVLEVAEGARLEIDGLIDAPPRQIFAGPGAVTGRVQNLTVLPQWFGARGDGVQDDAPAMQRAADLAADSLGRMLFIPEGDYLFRSDIRFRCNVTCRGRFIKDMEVDESRTQFSNDLFLPTHYLTENPHLRFVPDHPETALDPGAFFGIEEGALALPRHQEIPLADGGGAITLEEGDVLRFYSSDFFSSRNVRKGAHYYDKNDVVQVVSGKGDVFPEFAFSYPEAPDAPAWDPETRYVKGDYCSFEGEIFKATWPSGPGADYTHRHFGEVGIGPVPPEAGRDTIVHAYAYEDGTRDSIGIWRRVRTEVWRRPKDTPLTVDGLRIELRLRGHDGQVKRIDGGAMTVARSNIVFNHLEITVRDPEATMSRLLQSTGCVNIEYNNGYFSGATSAHLGYNILNSNVANVRYNHCVSTNSRKGMDGRHGKNITVNGGFYNVIDDHYGRNYVIRDIVLTGQSVFVPGDSTPAADLQAWRFGSRTAMNFNGANFHIENITIAGGQGGILGARSDIGDLYGDIVLRDVSVRGNPERLRLFRHNIAENFDYAHEVRVPNRLLIDNVRLENPGAIEVSLGGGFGDQPYGPVHIRGTEGIGIVYSASPDTRFTDCGFTDARFRSGPAARYHFRDCVFSGRTSGPSESEIAAARGNLAAPGARVSFPLDSAGPAID